MPPRLCSKSPTSSTVSVAVDTAAEAKRNRTEDVNFMIYLCGTSIYLKSN